MSQPVDTYEQKLQDALAQTGANQMTSQKISQAILEGQNFTQLAGFTIDLELDKKQQSRLISHLPVDPKKKTELGAAIQKALESAIPQNLQEALEEFKIDENGLRNALVTMASSEPAKDILEMALDNNRCAFEVFSAIASADNSHQRLKRLETLHQRSKTTLEIWNKWVAALPFVDQMIVINLLDISADRLERLAPAIGLAAEAFDQASPRVLAVQAAKPNALSSQAPPLLTEISKDSLFELLVARERARTVWFQTVGPNVIDTFSGVLDKTVPGYLDGQDTATLELPDFHLAIYENGVVKAQHFGIDGLLSTDFAIRTIAHTYRGALKDGAITLQESSIFAPNPKRPTLGHLKFTDFKVAASGLTAGLTWKGKAITLRWDPGF